MPDEVGKGTPRPGTLSRRFCTVCKKKLKNRMTNRRLYKQKKAIHAAATGNAKASQPPSTSPLKRSSGGDRGDLPFFGRILSESSMGAAPGFLSSSSSWTDGARFTCGSLDGAKFRVDGAAAGTLRDGDGVDIDAASVRARICAAAERENPACPTPR